MKILHTADWHLGKKLNEFSRLAEQREVLEELCQLAEEHQVDAVLVAGDLFDTFNPPTEAVELLYQTLHRLANNGERLVVAIAGNHDSADRVEAPDPLARACGIVFSGYPNTRVPEFQLASGIKISKAEQGFIEVNLPDYSYPLRLLLTPYANAARMGTFFDPENPEAEMRKALANHWKNLAEKYCDSQGVNILVTHLFMAKTEEEAPEEPEDERHILHIGGAQSVFTHTIPHQIQYTALGHLHRYQHIGGHPSPVVYSGSLLEYSFSETDQQKYAVLLNVEPGMPPEISKLPLTKGKKLIRQKFNSGQEAIAWLKNNQDCYLELTIRSHQYLEASLKKDLHDMHPHLMAIIPEIIHKDDRHSTETTPTLDLSQDTTTLFVQFYESREGHAPEPALMEVFKEVLNMGENDTIES